MDSKQRFSSRVANYLRYRPSYPPGVVDAVVEVTGLTRDWTIADLGSGTGLSSKPFLEHGNCVTGVEPNAEMRQAGDELLGDYARFHSVDGSAEKTGLADASIDLVLAGQAFHWFDQATTRLECLRILTGEKWAALVWNVRLADTDAFARGYEELLERFGTDYTEYRSRRIDPDELAAFFGTKPLERRMSNEQVFDFDGLRGRHLSASYAPRSGHPNHIPMMEELRRLFDEHASDGRVRFDYDTQVFASRIV